MAPEDTKRLDTSGLLPFDYPNTEIGHYINPDAAYQLEVERIQEKYEDSQARYRIQALDYMIQWQATGYRNTALRAGLDPKTVAQKFLSDPKVEKAIRERDRVKNLVPGIAKKWLRIENPNQDIVFVETPFKIPENANAAEERFHREFVKFLLRNMVATYQGSGLIENSPHAALQLISGWNRYVYDGHNGQTFSVAFRKSVWKALVRRLELETAKSFMDDQTWNAQGMDFLPFDTVLEPFPPQYGLALMGVNNKHSSAKRVELKRGFNRKGDPFDMIQKAPTESLGTLKDIYLFALRNFSDDTILEVQAHTEEARSAMVGIYGFRETGRKFLPYWGNLPVIFLECTLREFRRRLLELGAFP